MDEKQLLIDSIKETFEAILEAEKANQENIIKLLPKMSIKELQEIENEFNIDLYLMEENLKLNEVNVAEGTPTTNDGIPPNNKLLGILPTIL